MVSLPSLRQLLRLLTRPGAVRRADGLEVSVTSLHVVRREGKQQLRVRYQVPPLPDGEAWQWLPSREESLEEYAAGVAEELHGWATEHVRRHRPLPLPDRADVAHDLPSREALWAQLRDQLRDVTDVDGGFVVTDGEDRIQVRLTPEQWHELVIDREIGCRRDAGVDADGPGDGPMVAFYDLSEVIGSRDADETFVVLHRRRLTASTRAELPPVRGTALARKTEEILRQGGGSWVAYRPDAESGDG
jgi:hypothetical protein